MKKVLWILAAVAFFTGSAFFVRSPEARAQVANLMPLKKAKKNYFAFRELYLSGDTSNADAAIVQTPGTVATYTYFYRKTNVPKMNLGNLLDFRYYKKSSPMEGFEEESWYPASVFFVSQGGLWNYYGMNTTVGANTTYTSMGGGSYNYFQYIGALNKKKKSRDTTKIYSFNVSGDENNADAVVEVSRTGGTGMFQYYRKFAFPEMNMANVPDFRLYKKNSFASGFDAESWSLGTTSYFVTDGYIWIPYGTRSGSNPFLALPTVIGDYRIYLHSAPKKTRKKLKRQFRKRYDFSVTGNASNADKIGRGGTDTVSTYYYRKLSVPEMKIANMPNAQFMKKNNFVSGFAEESWSPNMPKITDGTVWANYGYNIHWPSGSDVYSQYIDGGYRIFLYK